MLLQSEAHAVLDRFVARLRADPNVIGAWILQTRGGPEIRLLLQQWNREHCSRIYEAHRAVDPGAILDVGTTDLIDEIPLDAEPLLVRR